MKKIAIVASGLLWATGIFADGVSSQEIVGYQTIPLKAGFNMITPTFTDAGTKDATYDIQNIKISDENGTYGWGAEQIQIVDENGNVSATYTWMSPDASGYEKAAWCDDSATPVARKLKQGLAFLLYTESAGVATVSGAVASGEKFATTLSTGFNGIGNASPVDVDIQKIIISDKDGTYGWGAEQIQIVDVNGNVSATYTWMSPDASGYEKAAWCDDSATPVKESIKAGSGFLLYTEGEGTVEVPTAL